MNNAGFDIPQEASRHREGVSRGEGPEGELLWNVDEPELAHALLRRAAGLSKRSWGEVPENLGYRFADVRNLVQPIFTETFLLHGGESWKRWRRWLVPLFSPAFALARASRFDRIAGEVLADATGPTDVQRLAHLFALRGILDAVFRESGIGRAMLAEVEAAVEANLEDSVARWDAHTAPASGHDPAARPAMQRLYTAVDAAIGHALASAQRADVAGKRFDLVSLVWTRAQDEAVALDELRPELSWTAANLIIAGAESLAAGLAFSCMELARCPHAQGAARAAAREVLPEAAGTRTLDAADQERLEAVLVALVEGMRLHPPARNVHRSAGEGSRLSELGAAAEDRVALRIDRIHRHPDAVSCPHDYRPARFTKEDPEHGQAWTNFLAFSAGQRACPGRNYALLEGTLFLARLLRDRELALPAEFVVPRGLEKPTTWAVGGMILDLRDAE